jgi:hypothetical protein
MHMDIDHIKKEGPNYIPLRVRPHLAWSKWLRLLATMH